MDKSSRRDPSGKFSTLFAAAVGSAAVVAVNNAADGTLVKTVSYFVPALTLLIAGIVGEVEELAVRKWRLYKFDLEVDGMIRKYDKYLEKVGVDEHQREHAVSKRNQLIFSHMDRSAEFMQNELNWQPEAKRKPSSRAVNRKQPTES